MDFSMETIVRIYYISFEQSHIIPKHSDLRKEGSMERKNMNSWKKNLNKIIVV